MNGASSVKLYRLFHFTVFFLEALDPNTFRHWHFLIGESVWYSRERNDTTTAMLFGWKSKVRHLLTNIKRCKQGALKYRHCFPISLFRRVKRLLNVYGIVKGRYISLKNSIDDRYGMKTYWTHLHYGIPEFQELIFRWLLLCEHWLVAKSFTLSYIVLT